jgi:two-component system, OmpR family, sensor kinase
MASRRAVVNLLDRSRESEATTLDHEAAPVLEAIDRCLARVDHLTVDILELASIPARTGRATDEFAVLDLAVTLRVDCSDRERVSCQLQPSMTAVGNVILLRHALLNLVENALRYTTGPVEVTLTQAAGGLLMLVDDHGEGVPEELRDVIFEPLARVDPTAAGGWGLGLALVRRVAEVHGGIAGVEGAPTGGARFVLWVPGVGSRPYPSSVAS